MPDLYNSIGLACDYLAEYSKALGYYDHAIDIQQETLRSNDPRLATTYYNIASVNFKTGEYATALSLFQRVLDIQQKDSSDQFCSIGTFVQLYGVNLLFYG